MLLKKNKKKSKMFTKSSDFMPSAQPFVPSGDFNFTSFGSTKEFKPFKPSSDTQFNSTALSAPF
jgi:hypothetical protein